MRAGLPGAVTLVAAIAALMLGSVGLRADAVNDAIEAGVGYLVDQIKAKRVEDRHGEGQVSIETYALVVAGVPNNDPLVAENFEWLENQRTASKRHTYTLSCYIFALDAAISQEEQDILLMAPKRLRAQFKDDKRIGRRYRPALERAVNTLVSLQGKHGGWDYGNPGARYDNSNTQFAVLALGVGAKRGVPIDKAVWLGIMDHFVKTQKEDGPKVDKRVTLMTPTEKEERENDITLVNPGRSRSSRRGRDDDDSGKSGRTLVVKPPAPEVGVEDLEVFARAWTYAGEGNGTWNMTCAGLSSLILARQNLRRSLSAEQAAALNKSIRDGYGELLHRWTPVATYYGMYSLEKVGDLGEVRLFGDRDWYKQLSDHLVGAQDKNGSWPSGGHGSHRVNTSFALLILNRATSLITGNPMSRIVVSGKGNQDPNDRSWVYVPSLDRTLHLPTLMRQIRMRPHRKLVDFLEDILGHYPLEWRGELIPELARTLDAANNKALRKKLEGFLVDITGVEYEDGESYQKWHRRWERVMEIGQKKDKSKVSDLLQYYENTSQSTKLLQTIMWALVQCNAREALPRFIADLENDDPEVRASAYNSMKAFYIELPPSFDPKGSDSTRAKQIETIRAWCQKQDARLSR